MVIYIQPFRGFFFDVSNSKIGDLLLQYPIMSIGFILFFI